MPDHDGRNMTGQALMRKTRGRQRRPIVLPHCCRLHLAHSTACAAQQKTKGEEPTTNNKRKENRE
jgi:hypothetical protein